MGFNDEYNKWLDYHFNSRSGERKGRLQRGHGHGEKVFMERVWWHIFGNFDDLHPEYEVMDWRGKPYFIDLVWKPGRCKFAFEVKGYGPHVQDTDRIRYRRELDREIYLQILGFRVVAIPYDDLEADPQLTINLLKSLLAPYMATNLQVNKYTRLESGVLLLTLQYNDFIRPVDIVKELRINRRTAVLTLQSLCKKGKLKPILSGKETKIVRYEFVRSFTDGWIW
ncbi:hypothetical protein EHS13_28000 [Paenibacillus psychroresistens]|uniref:DUF559 domain-containing protein n=1 Tax=Paenibacillus psychroresistens TaxID=1778678 RepID=A0A6B8RQ06_9BACL|nr:hypothetical protein [Paenibacillus psychroresistens]QGQ98450.1 hypothetical protein EHS13_28000 [Paenibacillus psychroresistens]